MITGNEPAIPCDAYYNGDQKGYCFSRNNSDVEGKLYGLTIRQQFAAMAMQGLLATVNEVRPSEALKFPTNIAQWSVMCADALINELNKQS